MTPQEFETWRKRHLVLFPGLRLYIQKVFGNDTDALRMFWEEWFRVLRKCQLEDAIEASRRLSSDTTEHEARYDRHPHLVAEICNRLKASRYDWDSVTEECDLCRGVGAVVIKRNDGYIASVRCTCGLGKKLYPFLREFKKGEDVVV